MSKVLKVRRRVGREGDEEHWIPLSDLMTSLMFLFLLIALAYMVQVQQQSTQTLKLIDDYRLQRNALYAELDREFRPDLRKWDAELTPDLTIRFHKPDVLFERGSDRLRPEFEKILREFFPRYVRILDSSEFRNAVKELRIEGTASSNFLSGTNSQQAYIGNMALSQNRARAVLEYVLPLVNVQAHHGWLVAHVTADGLSSSHPILVNNREDQTLSQRVDFRVTDPLWDRVRQTVDTQRYGEQSDLQSASSHVLPQRQQASPAPYSIDAVEVPGAEPVVINLDAHPVVGVKREQQLEIVGWATASNAPASAVYARLDGSRLIKATYGSVRDDVALALHNPALNHVGFFIDIPSNALSLGEHHVDFIIVKSPGAEHYIAPRRLMLDVQ